MKTTIDIADSLLRQAKAIAAKRQMTLRELVETALREVISAEAEAAPPPTLHTHTFRGEGLQAGLSWDDWSSLRDRAYEGRGG